MLKLCEKFEGMKALPDSVEQVMLRRWLSEGQAYRYKEAQAVRMVESDSEEDSVIVQGSWVVYSQSLQRLPVTAF